MANRSNFIFIALHVVTWLIFVGLCVELGGLLTNFFFSIYKSEFISHLYQKLDLIDIYTHSKWAFFSMYSFILAVSFLKAYLFYLLAMLMHKIDLSNPFSSYVSEQIMKIAYFTFSIGVLSYIARTSARNLQQHGYGIDKLDQFWEDSQAFILMSAVIYVIATIFKRGVAIQNENDLTI